MLMVTHGGFDNSDINKDVNAMFPIDRLHELVEEGFIGSLPEETYPFMGGGENVEKSFPFHTRRYLFCST